MQLGGTAKYFTTITNPSDIPDLLANPQFKNLPIFVLGGGSNVVAFDEGFDGLVIHIAIPGFEILNDDKKTTSIKVGAGESWDSVVSKTVELGLSGIECLSAIPGTAGAAPVQNIGAYGQELANTFTSLEAYDRQQNKFVTLSKADCGFDYRHSIFRGQQKGRYIITSITLNLAKTTLAPPFYEALQSYLINNNITDYSPASLRQAVTQIRQDKLPDPSLKPNSGSFFKNAIITVDKLQQLQSQFPDIKTFPAANGMVKVPTGWLIEQCGFKGQLLNGIRVHHKNALVLINESATNASDLIAARDTIAAAVMDKFGIKIEQEPLTISV